MLKPKRRRPLVTAFLVLAALVVLLCLCLILAVWVLETHLPSEEGSDVILVLGAQVKPDGTPSIALERRMTTALGAYRELQRPIICCGARGVNEPAPEGEVMRNWFLSQGCPEEDVIAETGSFNTRENLVNAKAIMQARGCKRALIVTSDYHVPRALALARQEGVDASGRGSPSKPQYFLHNHLREGLSWIKFLMESGWHI